MRNLFGNTKPAQIEIDEWWFNGRIICKQNDFRLPEWISFADSENNFVVDRHLSKKEAINYALENPCLFPMNFPKDYLG